MRPIACLGKGLLKLTNFICTSSRSSLSKSNLHESITQTTISTRNWKSDHNLKARMSSVTVKNFQDDERLYINLQLTTPTPSLSSTAIAGDTSTRLASFKFNLNRLKKEELRLAIDRLRLNLCKKQSKKSKKKKSSPVPNHESPTTATNEHESTQCQEEVIPIEIVHNGETLDLSVVNEKAWVDGALLKIGNDEIPILYNLPGATLDKLPSTVLEGCPLFPAVQTEFTTPDCCDFLWKTFDVKDVDKVKMQISKDTVDLEGAVKARSFTPQLDDVGKHVLLVCIPKRENTSGSIEAVISQAVVTKGPGHCPFETRQEQTKDRAEKDCFRVLSYNILAEIYSSTEFAKEHLFHYCPPEALDMDYRKHLLLKELVGYKADLLCLQEVDKHIFHSHLLPAFSDLGYTGLFKPKAGAAAEGCASFISNDKFRFIASHDIVLTEYLRSDPACTDIWTEVCKVESLREHIEERTSILQVTVAESTEQPGHVVCLCNTHLYYRPLAGNIRMIHAATALRYIQTICDAYTHEGKTTAMVFCGDFNSEPHLGVYQLMTCQMVPNDHLEWSSNEDQALNTLELFQPKNIISACGTPPYTNYTNSFQATLDYIFIDSDLLKVARVVPLPSDEEVRADVAIPSRVFPSDHLALVCDLKFS